jgi:hypothetical protein
MWLRSIVGLILSFALAVWLVACGGKASKVSRVNTLSISEVSPPAEIVRLNRSLDRYMPQVTIVSPKSDQILDSTDVKVEVAVKDLPIFQSPLGLGNHIDVVLDEREPQEIYDLSRPALFQNVHPGTHTVRVFASRPWDESFKNEGAYAQTTFHVLTRTGEHVPRTDTPVLTYHSPLGTVGSDTVLLDFYLHNAPVPASLLDSKEPSSWQIRATVNGDSFTIEDWHPLYLKGLKPGKNWIKLEFLDNVGNPLPNITNSIAQIITYDPQHKDTKSLLWQGQVIPTIDAIVDPNYPVTQPAVEAPKVEENPAPAPQLPIKVEEQTTIVPPMEEKSKPVEQAPIETPPPAEERIKTEEQPQPTEEKAQPVKPPRFQLFRKKAKVGEPKTIVPPIEAESQPPAQAPIETPPPVEETIKTEEQAKSVEEGSKPEEQAQSTEEPIVKEQPIEEAIKAENQPPMETPTPVEATIKAAEQPQPTEKTMKPEEKTIEAPPSPKPGRFQSLKERYQKQKMEQPVELPAEL